MRHSVVLSALTVLALGGTAACTEGAGTSGADASSASAARGAIKIWLSNNKEELAWGKGMVDAWNAAHPTEQVTSEEIPAGKSSEEVIGAAITAGNAPCLVFNTSPAAVPQFQKQGGLVALDSFPDGAAYVAKRTGKTAEQYKSPDGKFYQIPWKSNPVMIFYNKDLFTKAGIDAASPPLKTYAQFLDTSRKVVSSKAAQAAIWPAPTNEFFQPWFDYYPMYIAESGGKQLVEDNKATFASDAGTKVADFWATIYKEGLAPKEKATGDAFATGQAAMAIVGPWAIAAYKDVKWGIAPVPTSAGMSADQIHLLGRQERRHVLGLQEPRNCLGCHEVRNEHRAGRQAPRPDGPDAAAHRPDDGLRRLLHQAPGVQAVRRLRLAHGGGAQRRQLDHHLADLPGRLLGVGDLRQTGPRKRPEDGLGQGHPAHDPALTRCPPPQ